VTFGPSLPAITTPTGFREYQSSRGDESVEKEGNYKP